MNTISSEMQAKILYHLSGSDVTLFQRLNSHFKGIIQKFRLRPKITITFSQLPDNYQEYEIELRIQRQRDPDIQLSTRIRFTEMEGEPNLKTFTVNTSQFGLWATEFFQPLENYEIRERDFKKLWSWLFSKGDVALLNLKCELDPIFRQQLKSAIAESDCRIHEVELNFKETQRSLEEISNSYIKTIAEKFPSNTDFPKMKVNYETLKEIFIWISKRHEPIHKLSLISQWYSLLTITFEIFSLWEVLYGIAECWYLYPEIPPKFQLLVHEDTYLPFDHRGYMERQTKYSQMRAQKSEEVPVIVLLPTLPEDYTNDLISENLPERMEAKCTDGSRTGRLVFKVEKDDEGEEQFRSATITIEQIE